jgi:hypothetical protein
VQKLRLKVRELSLPTTAMSFQQRKRTTRSESYR